MRNELQESLLNTFERLGATADPEMIQLVRAFEQRIELARDKTGVVKAALRRALSSWGRDPSGRW